MNSQSTNISNIPLHCNVCPKRPDFSDVSHLLTHVASKGHLSNYYKMKVRGSTDTHAKKVVDDYDEWYEEWNLEELMRDRMSQKEKKRGGGGGNTGGASRRGSGAANAHSSRSTPSAVARGPRSNRLRDNLQLLDPQLGHRLRSEPGSRSGTPGSAFSFEGMPRTYVPSMGHLTFNGITWNSNSLDADFSPPIKQESLDSEDSDEDYDDDYGMPNRSSTRRRRAARQHYPSESITSMMDDNNSMDGLANDHTRLKGIVWPGMDMFDAATSEARRKRNQKKHGSVLRSLQNTSEVVQPTEMVFDAEGVLRKEREITGNPESEDSLIEGESEPDPEVAEKKRTRRRPRQALQDRNVNTGRAMRAHGQSHHPPFGRDRRRDSFFDGADDEDDLTYGQRRPNRRSGLSIHRDNTGPDITFDPQPRTMNYLTSAAPSMQSTLHGGLFQQNTQQSSYVPRSHPRQPSWGQMNGTFRPSSNGNTRSINQNQMYLPAATLPLPNITANPLTGFQPQYSMPQQAAVQTNNPLFQANHHQGSWEFLGIDHSAEPLGMMSPDDNGFFVGADSGNAMNSGFFTVTKEDDEATISAKSDH